MRPAVSTESPRTWGAAGGLKPHTSNTAIPCARDLTRCVLSLHLCPCGGAAVTMCEDGGRGSQAKWHPVHGLELWTGAAFSLSWEATLVAELPPPGGQ